MNDELSELTPAGLPCLPVLVYRQTQPLAKEEDVQTVSRIGIVVAIVPLAWCILFELFVGPEFIPGNRTRFFWVAMMAPAGVVLLGALLLGVRALLDSLSTLFGGERMVERPWFKFSLPTLTTALAFIVGEATFGANVANMYVGSLVGTGLLFFAAKRFAVVAKNASTQLFFSHLLLLFLAQMIGVKWFVQGSGFWGLVLVLGAALTVSLFSRETKSPTP